MYTDPTGHMPEWLKKLKTKASEGLKNIGKKVSDSVTWASNNIVKPVNEWTDQQVDNTVTGFTTLINIKERKEAFETIDTYGSESDKIIARVSAGTAVVAGTGVLAATAVYAAPYAAAAATVVSVKATAAAAAISVKAYASVSTTALGTYLWHNPDVGLDAYGLGTDVYNGNWGNIPTDMLAFAYNGAKAEDNNRC